MLVETDDLVAAVDISKMLGVGQAAVSNWMVRHADFPAPVVSVGAGRIKLFIRDDVLRWYAGHVGTAEDLNEQLKRHRAIVDALERAGES